MSQTAASADPRATPPPANARRPASPARGPGLRRQPVRFLVVHRGHAGAGLPDPALRRQLRRLGLRARGLDRAVQRQGTPDTAACQNAKGIGACWAVIADKYRLILFGRYPYDEQWRPAICVVLFIGLYVVSAMRRFWRKELALIWIATLAVIGVLMWGGVLGPAAGHRGLLGRPADHADPGDVRPRLRVPAGDPGGARPPLHQAAGGAGCCACCMSS